MITYLSEQEIEMRVQHLLNDYVRETGSNFAFPSPVEEIAENHLGLIIEFDDLHRRFDIPRDASGGSQVLGALQADGKALSAETA